MTYNVCELTEGVAVRSGVPFIRRNFNARDSSAVVRVIIDYHVFVASVCFCL